VIGRALGRSRSAIALGALLGAAGGTFLGGAIGRSLDQRDQQTATRATQEVLSDTRRPDR